MKNPQLSSHSSSSTAPSRDSKHGSKSAKLLQLLVLTGILAQISNGQVTINQNTPLSTVYDGVTKDKYVTYLQLDGSGGADVSIADTNGPLSTNLQYAFMLWFKPMGPQWGNTLMYAFKILGSYQCYFTQTNSLICESAQNCEKLQVDTSSIVQGEWAHITVSGYPDNSIGSYLSVESNSQSVGVDTKTYVIMRQEHQGWQACVGNCQSTFGFIGGVREFKFLTQYLPIATASRIKNHYLTWDYSILAYYRFSEYKFNQDEFRGQYAQIYTGQATSVRSVDYIPNNICFPFINFDKFAYITGDNQVSQTTLGANLQFQNYAYSMSLWVKINPSACSQKDPTIAISSCNIVKFDGVFLLYLSATNTGRFQFYADKDYYQTPSNTFYLPYDQWINIQIALDQYNGYEIRTYDILGRMMSYENTGRNLQTQRPSKSLTLLQHFRGYVKSFQLYNQRLSLPIAECANDCRASGNILYLKFQPQYMSGGDLGGVQLSGNPNFQATEWQYFNYGGSSTNGLVTYPNNLFDGIACNDNFMTLQLNSKKSYLSAYTPVLDNWLLGSTVEFWFKIQKPVNQTNYLFSMQGTQVNQEFFSIYADQTNFVLQCAPFGISGAVNSFVTYNDFNETNRLQYGWFHISCSYTYQKAIIGTLMSNNFFQIYNTSLATNPSYLPADFYQVIMGNTASGSSGTPLMLVKNLRVWSYQRSIDLLQSWSHRQINPAILANNSLLTYVRMSEASYDVYNFASVENSTIPSIVTYNDISYISNSEVTVCPKSTYYGNGVCYLNPITQITAAVYPTYNSFNQAVSWVFDASQTALINSTFWSTITISWQTSDPVLSYLAVNQSKNLTMTFPSNAFQSGALYTMTLNLSNTDSTFDQLTTVVFRPISCRWFNVQGSDSYSTFNNYVAPQGTNDITFSLSLFESVSGCSSSSFYNSLVQNITYQINPPTMLFPMLNFSVTDNRTISVTIPRAEQYKFTAMINQTIIFSIPWTNNNYSSLIQNKNETYQNVLYTIRFNTAIQQVIPVLNASATYSLLGEAITLNASGSYLTSSTPAQAQVGLSYSWICPTEISVLCVNKTGPILVLNSTDFVTAGGTFNKTYQVQVMISWTRTNGVVQNYYAGQNLVWYNIKTPAFTLYSPAKVAATGVNQQFQIVFNNYDVTNIGELNIVWSIIPNLTISTYYNYTMSNTMLTVGQGGFAQNTNYLMTVTVTNKNFPIATKMKALNYSTSQPPFGGSVSISPTSGVLAQTLFTINVTGWQSNNPPVQYKVWTTNSASGNVPQSSLNSNWVNANTTFSFFSTTTNPFQVQITDASAEITWVKVTANIVANSGSNITSSLQLLSTEQSTPLKYAYMTSLVQAYQQDGNSTSAGVDQTSIDQQISFRTTIVTQIQKDVQSIKDADQISNGNTELVISNTVSMLSSLLQDPQYLNDEIISISIGITSTLQGPTTVFSTLLTNSQDFASQYAYILSAIMAYSDLKQQNINVKAGRGLQQAMDTTTLQNIQALEEYVRKVKNNFMELLCSTLTVSQGLRQVQTPSFNILVEKFSLNQIELRSFVFSDDQITRANLNVQAFITSLTDPNMQAFCVYTTFYRVNPVQIDYSSTKNLTQYSKSLIEYSITDDSSSVDLTSMASAKIDTSFFFALQVDTFKANQSICMAYQPSTQQWTDSACLTTVDPVYSQIMCYCNLIDNRYFGIFTDMTRSQGSKIVVPVNVSAGVTSQGSSDAKVSSSQTIFATAGASHSAAFVGILLVLVAFAVGTPLMAVTLDKKDFQTAAAKIESKTKLELLKELAEMTKKPLSYWKLKQDQVFAYSLENKSLFSHYFTQIHPMFSILTKFEAENSRLFRYGVFFIQSQAFAILCVAIFGPSYRVKSAQRDQFGLDNDDVNAIVGLGFLGMLMLIPLAPLIRLIKKATASMPQVLASTKNNSTVDEQNKQDSQIRKDIYLAENTQEQNILQNSPIVAAKSSMRELQLQDSEISPSSVAPSKGRLVAQYTMLACGSLLSAASVALSVFYSTQVSTFNQYCMVASFYIGIFGGLFFTNILRIVVNTFLAEKVHSDKQSLWRFLVAQEALEILAEMELVKEAEQSLNQKSSVQKKLHQCEEIVVEVPFQRASLNRSPHDMSQILAEKQPTIEDEKDSDDAISISDIPMTFSPREQSRYIGSQEIKQMKDLDDAITPGKRSLGIIHRVRNSIEKSISDPARPQYKSVSKDQDQHDSSDKKHHFTEE